jgi:hypothetical protein
MSSRKLNPEGENEEKVSKYLGKHSASTRLNIIASLTRRVILYPGLDGRVILADSCLSK